MLPCHPLLTQRKLWVFGERELVFGIEMPRHVRQDCSSFHYTQIPVVVVDQYWDSSIRPIFGEPRLFLDVLSNVDALESVMCTRQRPSSLLRCYAKVLTHNQASHRLL
jgi:hypothetical protein